MKTADPKHTRMPLRAPLDMQIQDFSIMIDPHQATPEASQAARIWRFALFAPALLATALMVVGLYGWLSATGMTWLEWILLLMIGATFVWAALSVSTVCIAVAGLSLRDRTAQPAGATTHPVNVALLVPIYNECVSDVFGNAAAMLSDLTNRPTPHHFTLYILSDSRDPEIAAQELQAFTVLQANAPPDISIYYRRRRTNTDKKVGNLMDWITGWGARHEAMIVLDADSLMSGRAIVRLANAMACDENAGLIQSFPVLIGAETLFARLQQFSGLAYGWLLAEGLATWVRSEGNYWGHNAIIRIRAFAGAAGLPHLRGRRGRLDLILSHDFIEAGLLRRAGWRVRFMPQISGSFEKSPATLIDYVLRDRRWCRGNLQHLRLLGTRGMHPVSRYHLLHGAVSYLLSPAWFFLLVIWALLGKDAETNVIRYFNEANPLFPDWPPEMSHIDSAIFLLIMYAMLLAPKLAGAGIITLNRKATRIYGGRPAFSAAIFVEVLLSIAYAPVLMVQQCKAVGRSVLGVSEPWAPQTRKARHYPLGSLLRFHWLECLVGLLLTVGLLSGLVSLWLMPIATSLLLAVPLSAASALPVARCLPRGLRMENPASLREAGVVRRARVERARLADLLSKQQVLRTV